MKNTFFNIILFVLACITGYYSYIYINNHLYQLCGIFLSGFFFGLFLMNLKLNIKNDKLKLIKRKLEIESISGDEATSKIKVLESKIEVLEKALDNALNSAK